MLNGLLWSFHKYSAGIIYCHLKAALPDILSFSHFIFCDMTALTGEDMGDLKCSTGTSILTCMHNLFDLWIESL